ncbi:MAG: prolipoprotein diacylglyceryl transferase family protein, partial [Casimicrobiaceae bacterium]
HWIGRGDLMSLPVHPLPLYFMLLHLGLGCFLLWFRRRQTYDGQIALLGLLIGQGGKALLETFRQPIPNALALHLGAVEAAIAVTAGIALVVAARRGAPIRTPVPRGTTIAASRRA